MIKISQLGAALGLALATVCGAAHSAPSVENPIKVFYYSLNDLFINQLSVALQDRAIASQIKIAQYDAEDDLLRQVNQIQAAMSIKRDRTPILVNPVDTQNGSAALRIAKQNKVPIIFFNRSPDREVLATYDDAWYVGTNGTSAGYYQAEIVMDYLKAHPEADKNKDGYISYVMLKGEAGHQDTDSRTGSFIRTMLESQYKLKPLMSVNANWSQAKAQNELTNYIELKGINDIELIVCNNDAMALGAIIALQAEGYNLPKQEGKDNSQNFIPVVGLDALPSALDAVERGTMIGTVLNDYKSMADVMLRIGEAYLNGEVVTERLVGYEINEHTINIPYKKVTNQNVDDVR